MWLANGHRKRETGFLNRADVESAVSKIRQLEKEMKYGFVMPVEAPSLQEACEKKLSLTPNQHEYVRAKRVLSTFCLVSQVDRINEIKTEHLQKFVDLRRKDGLSPQSVDRELNIISACLRSAVIHFSSLSEWKVPCIPRPKHSKRRRERIIQGTELVRVMNILYSPPRDGETAAQSANRRNVGHVLLFANLTGARKGEICKLRWSQIDWDAGVIQIVGTKTENRSQQTSRYIAMDRALKAILLERQGVNGEFVFTRAGGEVTHYYKIIREACQACGVKYGRDVAGGFVTHDARHTAVTQMLQKGIDLATIGSITGHGDRTMILRYGHATTESQRKAMRVLESFAGFDALGLSLETVVEKREKAKENDEYGAGGRNFRQSA